MILQIWFEHQLHEFVSYYLGRDYYRKLLKIHKFVAVVHTVN